ncbi:hypothetical protein [Neobacillus jeddahensis]|nr:hypothetical protein [Neobacillus jeddahensis]
MKRSPKTSSSMEISVEIGDVNGTKIYEMMRPAQQKSSSKKEHK